MAELTEREIKIVHLFLTMLNSKFADLPMDTKQGLLKTTLAIRKIRFDEDDLADLVRALEEEQNMIIKNSLGHIAKSGSIANIHRLLRW